MRTPQDTVLSLGRIGEVDPWAMPGDAAADYRRGI